MATVSLAKLRAEHLAREAKILLEALEKSGWRLSPTACALGMSPSSLQSALKERHPSLEKRRLATEVATTRRVSPITELSAEYRQRERVAVQKALELADWKLADAAKRLEVTENTLVGMLRHRYPDLDAKWLEKRHEQKMAKRGRAA